MKQFRQVSSVPNFKRKLRATEFTRCFPQGNLIFNFIPTISSFTKSLSLAYLYSIFIRPYTIAVF